MSGAHQRRRPVTRSIEERIAALGWTGIETSLLETGFARTGRVLGAAECRELVALYPQDQRFRKRIDMESHVYGRGDYAYFTAPLPSHVAALRRALYPKLAPIANRFGVSLGWRHRYPERLDAFLTRCHRAGQERPTPLLLRYREAGYNRMHQDLYGDVFFPLQVTAFLSEPSRDFEGGEFLLSEQRARTQARVHVLRPRRGELVIFPTRERPGRGAKGPVRIAVKHGVATLTRGERYTLGVIFHDAT